MLGNGKALAVPNIDKESLSAAGSLAYTFNLSESRSLRVWLRCWWQDGCSNSIFFHTDKGPKQILGNDSIYNNWHWVRGPNLKLKSGKQSIYLRPREANVRIDQILLLPDGHKPPTGAVGHSTEPVAHSLPNLTISKKEPKFLVGIGGDYQNGWEPTLVQLGIPYRRVTDADLGSFDKLKKFSVLCVTSFRHGADYRAIEKYLMEGGTLILEYHSPKHIKGSDFIKSLSKEVNLSTKDSDKRRNRLISRPTYIDPQGSPFFEGFDVKKPVRHKLATLNLQDKSSTLTDFKTHGLALSVGKTAPAMITGMRGKGKLYLFCTGFGFSGIRDDHYQPLLTRVMIDAIGKRWQPAYKGLNWSSAQSPQIYFHDDFMRPKSEGVGWDIQGGTWKLTSGTSPKFILRAEATETARLQIPGDGHEMPRISVSLQTELSKNAGVYLALPDSSFVDCLLVENGTVLSITHRKGETILASGNVKLSEPHKGWRRISLYGKNGTWLAFVDGRKCLEVKGDVPDPETLISSGLVLNGSHAFFDDVDLRPYDALISGTDRGHGEEGSSRSFPPLRKGLEFRSIYSPLFEIRPVLQNDASLTCQYTMPTYSPSTVYVDGTIAGSVDPNPLTAYFQLKQKPTQSLAVINPGIRDYLFAQQLVDWYAIDGKWRRKNRWSCDKNWFWIGAQTQEPSILWYRHSLSPPYAVRFAAAEGMGNSEKGNDLNMVIGGNGTDLKKGIVIRTIDGALQLTQDSVLKKTIRAPLYQGWKLHHIWIDYKVIVEEKRVRVYCDDRLLIDYRTTETIGIGQPGFWTQQGFAQLARATVVTAGK
ncbi:MAG: hypothetical protein HRT89_10520 [Lentisphaeria bacterium]|nr:hypothetical protein [Lentisphaeria bacterium]NQZ68490.1 hypothetical protein [Lentisphaeria bacterium]